MVRLALIGPKGSGKTELMRLLSTLTDTPLNEGGTKRLLTFSFADPDLELVRDAYSSEKASAPSVTVVDVDNVDLDVLEVRKADMPAIRESDALILVLRADLEVPSAELKETLWGAVRKVIEEDVQLLQESLKGKWVKRERERAELVRGYLERLQALSSDLSLGLEVSSEERHALSPYSLLTLKPMVLILNVSYEGASQGLMDLLTSLEERLSDVLRGTSLISDEAIALDVRLERELLELGDEAGEFMEEYGLQRLVSADGQGLIARIIRGAGFIRFFTANQREAREYLVRRGATALECAGKVHTDMMKGFIRAEVINVKDLKEMSLKEAERLRKKRVDRAYQVEDGDVLYVLFSR